jgi:hypothetical protein
MTRRKNIYSFNILDDKHWVSSWYAQSKQYSLLLQNDIVLYCYIRSLFFSVHFLNLISVKLYRYDNVLIMDFFLFYSILFAQECLVLFVKKINMFSKLNIFLSLKKLCLLDLLNSGFYIAFKIARLVEKRIKFRSKTIKSMLKEIKKQCLGVFVQYKGRINNLNIARSDKLYLGSISLQTVNISISYGQVVANTAKGLQCVKVWISYF